MDNVGVKSTKLYEVKSNYGSKFLITLVCREYKYGKCLYILKFVQIYYKKGIQYKKVYKFNYHFRDIALKAFKNIYLNMLIENIDNQLFLPF